MSKGSDMWRLSCAIFMQGKEKGPRKKSGSHIGASHSQQPLIKAERLVRYEVNAVMQLRWLIHWFVRKVYVILSAGAMGILCEDAVPNTMKPQSLIIKLFP